MPWLSAFKWSQRFDGALHPAFGQKLGFEVHVNDDDNEGDDSGRENNIGWFYPADEAWHDPSTLGDMKMFEEIYPSVREETASFRLRVQPNPATDELQLISNTSISHIEVFNMVGACVRQVRISNERVVRIDVSGLSDGVYLINAYNLNGKLSTGKFLKE